ncbi:MAG: class I SAM-dependent methyltransferase [Calditrichia bacterium]
MRCVKCGLVYRNPRPPEDELLSHFASDEVSGQHKKAVWYDAKIKLFEKNLRKIEKLSSKGRLLDVGCGYGTFLKMAADMGWRVSGVELSSSACKYASETLGLNIFKGTLKNARFQDNYFDVVTLWGVLELLNNPSDELLEINRILKSGGLLVFRTRNVTFHLNVHLMFDNLARRLKIKPTVFQLYGFSAKTATRMLEKTGFNSIKVVNSELTTGDPYKSGEIFTELGMKLIKTITYSVCQSMFYLTGGSLILAPSILVFAKKPLNDSEKGYVKN